MPKTFKNQPLIEVDRVDGMGDYIPREVMEKAVKDLQERLKSGAPLLITTKFSNKLGDTQGLVSDVRMEGNQVLIDGTILDTAAGQKIQTMLEAVEKARKEGQSLEDPIEYAMGGQGVPKVNPETKVREYSDVSITSVAVVGKGEKVR